MIEHLYPRLHLRPSTGWVNDPNGPFLLNGIQHMYFQNRATVDGSEPVRWGHATSRDLLSWQIHEPALTPHTGAADEDGSWSGNVAVVDGVPTAFYSGFRIGQPHQPVLRAPSFDGGQSFGVPTAALPDPLLSDGVRFLRDPFVWMQDDQWRAVVGAGYADNSRGIRHYVSLDGTNWRFDRDLVRTPSPGRGMWECPQVLTLGDRDVILAGEWAEGFALGPVHVLHPGGTPGYLADEGTSFYAPSVQRDGKVGGLLWGWAVENRELAWAAEDGWAGAITFPRRVTSGRDGRLHIALADEVRLLRGEPEHLSNLSRFEIQCTITVRGRIVLRFGDAERVEFTIDTTAGEIVVDGSSSSRDARAHPWLSRIAIDDDSSPVGLRILVDGSIIEVFTSEGRCATFRAYPLNPPPWHVSVHGADDVRAWTLRIPGRP